MGKVRKFILSLSFPLLLLVGLLSSCSLTPKDSSKVLRAWMEETGRPKVLATTGIVGELVGRIGGEQIDLLVLMPPQVDPHSYQIVKGDSEKFTRADMVFSSGLSLEHSASMQAKIQQHPKSILIGDAIRKKASDEMIVIDHQIDPHVWMDLSLWSKGIDEVVTALSDLLPEHQAQFAKRGETTRNLFLEKDQEIQSRMLAISEGDRYLVTSHDAFNYFGRRYLATKLERSEGDWTTRIKSIQGLAPDEQISPLEIIDTVRFICSRGVGVIFPEANLSPDSLRKVVEACNRKGVCVVLSQETLFGDTLGDGDYMEMMDHNTQVLESQFKATTAGRSMSSHG